ITLGGGTSFVNLAGGTNSVSVAGVSGISASDFDMAHPINDTLTLLNDVSNMTVNLQLGDNTLVLAAGANSFPNPFNVQHVIGSASANDILSFGGNFVSMTSVGIEHIVGTAANDQLTLNNNVDGLDISLGGGSSSLQLAAGANTVSVANVAGIGISD